MFSRLFQTHYIIVIVLLQFNFLYSQQDRDVSLVYNWFDEKIGIENSGLYNGSIYTDEFTIINDKHQFFNSPELSLGNVTYDGQTYYGQKIKYDLFNDMLLITPKNKTNGLLVKLERAKTKGFSIKGHSFIKADNTINGASTTLGFCEIISKKGTSLLVKKYRKKKVDKRGAKKVYEVYQEFKQNINYFVLYDNMFYPVDSKREWILAFPNHKKAIKNYYKKYAEVRKTDVDTFMKFALENLFSFQQDQNNSF
ncbi:MULTISPECIES: hypothetical protein [unclassified Croceitalea]|uniref:hypothetical protein n=1 Tax=unclassified Croceitalea TaxID=2632280 RepID=UPI0030DC0A3F